MGCTTRCRSRYLRAGGEVAVVGGSVGGCLQPARQPAAEIRQLLVNLWQHLALHHPLKFLVSEKKCCPTYRQTKYLNFLLANYYHAK